MTGDKIMKKIIVMMLLMMITIGCELFDSERLDRIERENEERGRVCERNEKGYWSCFDTKQ